MRNILILIIVGKKQAFLLPLLAFVKVAHYAKNQERSTCLQMQWNDCLYLYELL